MLRISLIQRYFKVWIYISLNYCINSLIITKILQKCRKYSIIFGFSNKLYFRLFLYAIVDNSLFLLRITTFLFILFPEAISFNN